VPPAVSPLVDPAPEWYVPSTPLQLGPFEEGPHQQIVRAARLQWNAGVGEARLRLHPEHLGEVTIALRVEQGNVTATLAAANQTVAEWMRSHRAELQSSLVEQGLTLASLEVVVDPDERRRPAPRNPLDTTTPRRRRAGNQPTFDLHV
jgi:flagellar hook-length control protein FliK